MSISVKESIPEIFFKEKQKMDSQLFTLFKEFYKEHPYLLTSSILLSSMSHGIETILIPMLLSEIFTNMEDSKKLYRSSVWFLLAYVLSKGFGLGASYMDGLIEPHLSTFITNKFVQAVFLEYDVNHKPVQVALIMEKIRAVRIALENFLSYVFTTFIPSAIILLIATVRILYVSIMLGVLVLFGLVILGIMLFALPRPKTTIMHKDAVSVFVEDVFQNMEFITSTEFGRSESHADISDLVNRLHLERIRYQNTMTRNQTSVVAFASLLYISNIMLMYNLFITHKITVKQFESSILTVGRMYEIVFNIAYYIPEFIGDVQSLIYLEKFTKHLFSFPEKVGLNDKDVPSGHIEFDNVTFGYSNDDLVYKDISVKIDAGTSVALCGPSGCGKTTFVKLILDIIQPLEGKLFVGGKPLSSMTKRLISHNIASISQNTSSLLKTSIYKNITYGIEHTPDLRENVERIIEEHNLDRVFGSVGFLYHNVEKGGSSLSGGQKQVIHLVHAILNKNAKIYILDEPSSAMDTKTRQCVFDLIRHLTTDGRTVLVITHDHELRDICDIVFTFKKGENPVQTR